MKIIEKFQFNNKRFMLDFLVKSIKWRFFTKIIIIGQGLKCSQIALKWLLL